MTQKITSLVFLFIVLVSCTSTPIKVEQISLNQDILPACKDTPCPKIMVDYIQYTGDKEVVDSINIRIEKYITEALYLGNPDVTPTVVIPKIAMEHFVTEYWRDTSEFPEINEYEAEVMIEETYRSNEIASVALKQYKYTGGAHGYGSLQFENFNIKTGKILTIDQLIKDKESLTQLAEKQLRLDFNLSANESINAKVFWFENDTFYLSNAIGFKDDHLIIHYNQYEIASYADGPIDIKLPIEEVADFLNISVKK